MHTKTEDCNIISLGQTRHEAETFYNQKDTLRRKRRERKNGLSSESGKNRQRENHGETPPSIINGYVYNNYPSLFCYMERTASSTHVPLCRQRGDKNDKQTRHA